jgi:hypothetical protein
MTGMQKLFPPEEGKIEKKTGKVEEGRKNGYL